MQSNAGQSNTGWGLIAGNGRFPFLVLEGARSQGIEMAVIALKEEASPELEKLAKRLHWVSLGELSKAIELMVTGNTFSFEEAKELGIVNDIYERDNFMENIMEYARQFCPPNKAAKAVGRIKRAVQTGWEIPMESALAVERENQQLLFQSEDAKEGLAAYVEKRPAVFKAK